MAQQHLPSGQQMFPVFPIGHVPPQALAPAGATSSPGEGLALRKHWNLRKQILLDLARHEGTVTSQTFGNDP